ncbi:MAG: DUF488 family protein [Prochlorotrichaceae cyanobacterium]
MNLFTIGHSNHSITDFIKLLQQHEITALADVRSNPYSRYLPDYCQAQLKDHLKSDRIHYVFLGQELGARPQDQSCYVEGKAIYEKIAETDLFTDGIRRILKGVKRHRIALMCAEKDPLPCHRAILVCQHLRDYDLDIQHIHPNGTLETHDDLENRLLTKHGFKGVIQTSLFEMDSTLNLTDEDQLIEAYKKQGLEIAYVEKNTENFN